ncbi:MAG: PAS domain S-box protein, partial [Smithella sp.]
MEKLLRILMLEDNRDDAELLEFELQEAGFDYVSRRVITEEDFLNELRKFSPDIILSDYDLPTYSGAKALAAARAFCPDIPFILVTGAISEDRAIDTLTSGAKDYVMKTRLHRLAPAIKRALAEAEEHKARRKAEEDLWIAHRELEKQVAERTSELKESRERLSLALTSSKMGIFEWDIVENKRYWDHNVHMILGTSPDHFSGTAADFFKVVHSEDRIVAKDSFKKALDQQDDLYETDLRAVWPDGSVHYIATRGKVYYDHFGLPVRMIGVCWDITERKKAEEALRHSERRERERAMELAALLDAVPMPVFIAHDPGCLRLTGNRAANDFMMHSNIKETSLAAPTVILPDHIKAFKDGRKLNIEELPIQQAARGIKVQEFEYSLEMEKGTTRHVLGYSTPLLDAQGSPRGAVQALVDITDHKRIEEELREANAETKAILTGIADVFYSLDNQWRFTVVNPAAERELFGRSVDELLGKVIWEVFPALVGTKPQQCYFEVVQKNEMGHYEAKSPLNGRWYEVFVSPRQGGLDVYLRNIDKRKQAENALREALFDVENSRSRLEAVFAAQNDIVLIYDTAMDVQKTNKAFINLCGFDPTGLNIKDLIKRVSCRWLSGKPLLL